MDRRKFLKFLGVGAAAVVAAPALLTEAVAAPVATSTCYQTYIMGKSAIIGGYADYAKFSDFALASSIDEVVSNTAAELGRQAGESVRQLHRLEFS